MKKISIIIKSLIIACLFCFICGGFAITTFATDNTVTVIPLTVGDTPVLTQPISNIVSNMISNLQININGSSEDIYDEFYVMTNKTTAHELRMQFAYCSPDGINQKISVVPTADGISQYLVFTRENNYTVAYKFPLFESSAESKFNSEFNETIAEFQFGAGTYEVFEDFRGWVHLSKSDVIDCDVDITERDRIDEIRGLFTISYYDIFVVEENNHSEVHLTLTNSCHPSSKKNGSTIAFVNLPSISTLEKNRETIACFTDRIGNAYELYFGNNSTKLQISKTLSVPKVYVANFDAIQNPNPEYVSALFTMTYVDIDVINDSNGSMIEFRLKEPNHFYGILVNTISSDDTVVRVIKWFRDKNGTPYEIVLLSDSTLAVRLAD